MIVQEIAAFLAFSLVWLPLTGLFTWGLFSVLKHSKLPRTFALLTSCLIVLVCLHLFESTGRGSFDKNDVYELIDIGVWLVVGLMLGGKSERVVPPKIN
jgi:hypothetical protein